MSAASASAHLVAVDWGTSSLRGARLDASGQVLEERAFARGIMTVPPGEFASVFEACFADWMGTSGSLCLISGMAGSRQGWMEAPYCACPAGFDEVAAQLAWTPPGPQGWRIAIVPGLSCEHPASGAVASGLTSVPDVMRGEEVQIFGAMRLTGLRDGMFVLPGTHSKWATVRDGRITGFLTFMTGEFYALLSQHSILSKTVAADAAFDEAAFALGVAQARGGAGLLHHAFSARSLSLFGRMQAAPLASYLSGLVIGEELRSRSVAPGTDVVLIGSAALTRRYAQALALQGVPTRALGADATWAGLAALAAVISSKDSAHAPR